MQSNDSQTDQAYWANIDKLDIEYSPEHLDRYRDFCDTYLSHVNEIVYDWVNSEEFRALLRETVRATYPVHEHEKFLGHFGGLVDAWVRDNS